MVNTHESWQREYLLGVAALDRDNVSRAIQHLKASVGFAQGAVPAEPMMRIRLILADAYRIAGDMSSALKEYTDVAAKATNRRSLQTIAIIAQGSIGVLLAGQNQRSSLDALEKAVEMIRQPRQRKEKDFVPIIMCLAMAYAEVMDLTRAEEVISFATAYAKETLGPADETTISCLNLYVGILELAGKKADAEKYRREIDLVRTGGRGSRTNFLGIIPVNFGPAPTTTRSGKSSMVIVGGKGAVSGRS